MADQAKDKSDVTVPVVDAPPKEAVGEKSPAPVAEETAPEPDGEAPEAEKPEAETEAAGNAKKTAEDATEKPSEDDEKAAVDGADADKKDASEAPAADEAAGEAAGESSAPPAAEAETETAPVETPASKGKSRRKSTAGDSKGKALNRKSSKARLTHLNAQPGDHFLVKLKGFPAWPAIICDESMLPAALVNSRPVTAARPDGTYADAYADGGKRAHDRSFAVMYLCTNEFGWIANTSLTELSPEKAQDSITEKMRKDLKEAFQLAAESNPIDHYKDILKSFQDELIAQEEARREAAATPKKKKGKAKAVDEDVTMPDFEMDDIDEKPKSKKRKADEEAGTPQRSESVKKPKIKLNTSTPKANGTPKAKDESVTKSKSKTKKSGDKKAEAPKESKLTPEERRSRKEKEVLYLRHKLQRGLLTRDQEPQESEMKQMSEYITMLENFHELEVAIIRVTKINKVLKAILKLESIPREEEFHFKERSQVLLNKWNKLLANEGSAAPAATNGVNGKSEEKKTEANGVKEDAKTEEAAKAKAEPKSEAAEGEEKAGSDEAVAPPEPVEATA